jgi:hypothetical protein
LHGLERLVGADPRMPKVPPAWINEPLYLASRLEQKTLGRLPIPFGNSLMVIASRPPSHDPSVDLGTSKTATSRRSPKSSR